MKVCRGRFREKGGYNIEAQDAHKVFKKQPTDLFGLTTQSASALCDSLESPDIRLDRSGNAMLHFAAMCGNCAVISYLVQKRGASIDIQNRAGETPLYKACLSADLDAVRILIGLSANAVIPAKATGASCLHWLFNFENDEMTEVAELLIHQGGGNFNAEIVPITTKGQILPIAFEHFPFHWPFGTPLHWAVAARSRRAVETLLHFRCNINASDLSGVENEQTALTMAMYRADPEMMELLVANGAKADMRDSKARNLIHILVADHAHMNRALRLPRSVWSWVTHGSSQNHMTQLRGCLAIARDLGLDLDAVRRKCQTPLIDAVENADACTISVLLDAGANANVLNPMGELPIHEWLAKDSRLLAYPELYFPVLERLVFMTKDLNERDELYLQSAVHYAATTNGDQEQFETSLRMLLAKDPPAGIDAQDRRGLTPFLKLLENLNTGAIAPRVATFIRFGANVMLKDKDGRGFLHVLCENASLSENETLGTLTSILTHVPKPQRHAMARTCGLSNGGPNALTPAVHHGKLRCVELLIELGVDINALDMLDKQRRWTPLDCAIHFADYYREALLSRLVDSFAPADRMTALKDGTAFADRFSKFGKIH